MEENQYWEDYVDSSSFIFGTYIIKFEVHKDEKSDSYYIEIGNTENGKVRTIEDIPSYEEAIEKAKQIKTKIVESDEALLNSITL